MHLETNDDSVRININLLHMNVRELKHSRIQTYAIVTCAETKLDDLNVLTVDKFVVVQKNQKTKVQRKSGGIAALIKSNSYKHIKYIDRDCDYVSWFKLY